MKTYDPQDFKIDVICTFAPVTKYRTYFGTFSMWIVNMCLIFLKLDCQYFCSGVLNTVAFSG